MRKLIIYMLLITVAILSTSEIRSQNNNQIQLAHEYYSNGELEKARKLFDDLAKNSRNIPLIHRNYLAILIDLKEFQYAEKYVERLIRRFPNNLYYKLDLGLIYRSEENVNKSDAHFKKVIGNIKEDNYKVRITSQYFINKNIMDFAILTYQEARKANDNKLAYSLEMANIYKFLNRKEEMVQEYLNYAVQNPVNINYVKNSLQNLLPEPEDLEKLETLLYEKVQKQPNKEIYGELLIWVNLQQKNFYGAFIQARALDKRLKLEGRRVLDIGNIAKENEDFVNSIKIFDYVIKEYPGTFNFILAKMYLIESREEMVKKTFPVDKDEIRTLIRDYESFIEEIGLNRTTMEALRNQAILYAFYLDKKDSAIRILQKLISAPRVNDDLKASSKLDLGDIYILTKEPWESTLLYSQVEKSHKETKIGYEAKLRNAKLSYFKGDFTLAQEHLDILKLATTREIANDAMKLSILIQDNTGLDSTDLAMRKYASIELLLFQNKTQEALESVDQMLKNHEGHSLTDELWMLQANIYIKSGEFPRAVKLLEKIVNQYDYDVLSDDAYFMMGEIYELQIGDKDAAMEIYRDFLTRYPGSIFSAEARKRFRSLRGDFKNHGSS